jgi:acetyl-CoA decarbonylase/synthase complex subunit gamma
MTAYLANDDPVSASYWETVLASVFSVRYGDIMIVHSIEPYALLPELHIRDTIYTDPRVAVLTVTCWLPIPTDLVWKLLWQGGR